MYLKVSTLILLTQNVQTKEGTDVDVFVEAHNLVDLDFLTVSDPMCSLKTRPCNFENANWTRVGETEVIDNNLNPEWIRHFNVKYIFHKDLDLCFQVWHVVSEDEKKMIGETII